ENGTCQNGGRHVSREINVTLVELRIACARGHADHDNQQNVHRAHDCFDRAIRKWPGLLGARDLAVHDPLPSALIASRSTRPTTQSKWKQHGVGSNGATEIQRRLVGNCGLSLLVYFETGPQTSTRSG